VRNTDTAKQPA